MSIHPTAYQLLRCMAAVINALKILRIIDHLPLLKIVPCLVVSTSLHNVI